MGRLRDDADRVKDTSTTTGTGSLTLSGSAPTGYVTFNAGIGQGPRFCYTIQIADESEWEVGVGYLSAATTLVRERVMKSTNSNNAVNFSAGTKTCFVTFCADRAKKITTRGVALMMVRGCYLT